MSWNKYKYIARGCLTFVPGLRAVLLRRGTGGTTSARYCYSVWLRHMVMNAALSPGVPRSVAELGPGDSLGIGLTALLCGAERYIALDALPHASSDRNLAIFDQLVELLKSRAPIPDDTKFPDVHPKLTNYDFPSDLLPDTVLAKSLEHARVSSLRQDVRDLSGSLSYLPNWQVRDQPVDARVDLIVSQAVLEHVDDLVRTYDSMFGLLRPGGVMSHQIDFKCHETADIWNGHLAHSDLTWRLMRGNMPYFVNRRTLSEHVAAAEAAGFQRIAERRVIRDDGLPATRLAPRFRAITDLDARTSGAFLQAIRPLGKS